jgi:hypothetical protein
LQPEPTEPVEGIVVGGRLAGIIGRGFAGDGHLRISVAWWQSLRAMSQQGVDPLLATPIVSAAPLGRRTDGAIGADDQELSRVAVPCDQFDQQMVCFLVTDRESDGDERFAPIGRQRKLGKLLLGIEFDAGLWGIKNDERFFLDRFGKV